MIPFGVDVLHRARAEPGGRPGRAPGRLRRSPHQRFRLAPGWCRGWSATPSARCSACRCSRSCRRRSHSCRRHASSARSLIGILLFFLLEKLVLWRHCHTHDCEVHDGSVFPVVVGDAFHNFVDGAAIAAAVMTSVPLGVSMAVAVAAHEIPQEVGDFAILLHAGYSRSRALLLNVLSALGQRAGRGRGVFRLRNHATHASVFSCPRGIELSLCRHGRSHPRPSPRPDRCGLDAADPPDRRRRRDDARPLTSSSPEDARYNAAEFGPDNPICLTPRRWQSLCPVMTSGGTEGSE